MYMESSPSETITETATKTPDWADSLLPFLKAPSLESADDLHRASSAAQGLTRSLGVNEEVFWRQFFEMAAMYFPALSVQELARRFSTPADFIPVPKLPVVIATAAKVKTQAQMLAEVEAEAEAAQQAQYEYERRLSLRRRTEEFIESVKESLEDLKKSIPERETQIAEQLFSPGCAYWGGSREIVMVRAYGGLLALDMAIKDHAKQFSRLNAELGQLETEIAAIEAKQPWRVVKS
jgi:hypothetical protein